MLGAVDEVDALGADGGDQIVQVVRGVHVLGDHVIDVAVGEVALFFACVDQVCNIVAEFLFHEWMLVSVACCGRRIFLTLSLHNCHFEIVKGGFFLLKIHSTVSILHSAEVKVLYAGVTEACAQGCEKIFFEERKISHMRT